ncbi:PREDICTED: uncharacterized protein LOC108355902, partial [Rhagoletis zephyria]|uniref:uncharacterized protein LOC108355902 n=1 Tax=Rhagoletis zephyria TaxID=28612 RepID=UPI0008119168
VNRQYPWYMQPPEYDAPFQLADYVHQEFNGKLQQAVIRDIHTFNCKLMFIDLAVQVCLHEMHQWLEFTRFAFIIVVARSQDAVKQIKLMGQNLTAVMIEEDIKRTWQEQLTESLHVCMAHASELGLVEYCTQSFAFVFSRNRNSCRLNTHRVLRMKA